MLVFWFLAFRTGVKKLWLWFVRGGHVQWSSPDMVDEIYDIYWICMGTTHCATLGTTAEFWNKGTHQKGVMQAPQKSENSKSVSNHNASCCPVTDVFFCEKTRIKRKQHIENISQMYDKNSCGFCQRSSHKETLSAHPFEGARYWLGCSRSTLPCHRPVGEIAIQRMTDTSKPSKTLKPLKSKLPTRPYIFSTSFSMVCPESFRDKEITTLRRNYETGTFHASSL